MEQVKEALQSYIRVEILLKKFFDISGMSQYCQTCQISAREGDNKCCNSKKYGFNKIDSPVEPVFREAQKILITPSNIEKECKTMSKKGCQLTYFREPICLAHLCSPEINILKRKYGIVYCPIQIVSSLMGILNLKEDSSKLEKKIEAWINILN